MQIAIIENSQIVETGDIRNLFPNVSFPETGVDISFLEDNSAVEVVNWISCTESQKLETVEPYLENGKVYTVRVTEKSSAEIQQENTLELLSRENLIRNQRNQFLKDSDWTQVADAPVDKPAWAIYRQALRDITEQAGFPNDVTFPNPPL